MTINIHSIHFHIDKNLESFIKKKINKLLKLDNKVISSDVFFKIEQSRSLF
jgi:ribosome-associated translation inhibitor RaiA